jgi:hypothetical protein
MAEMGPVGMRAAKLEGESARKLHRNVVEVAHLSAFDEFLWETQLVLPELDRAPGRRQFTVRNWPNQLACVHFGYDKIALLQCDCRHLQ